MIMDFAEETAIDDLVGAILASAAGAAFEALDRLIGDQDGSTEVRERIAVARARRR